MVRGGGPGPPGHPPGSAPEFISISFEDEVDSAVADPGFPVGLGRRPVVGRGGRRPPTHTLFSKNVCENERNGSCWGVGWGARR